MITFMIILMSFLLEFQPVKAQFTFSLPGRWGTGKRVSLMENQKPKRTRVTLTMALEIQEAIFFNRVDFIDECSRHDMAYLKELQLRILVRY